MKRIIKIPVLIVVFLSVLQAVSAESFSFVTMNAWSAMDNSGLISCNEYEPENDRLFRNEILSSALAGLDADVIVLNDLNPANRLAESIAAGIGMNAEAWISQSGVRIGPVSLPVNLKSGDAILTADALSSEPAGRLHMNGMLAGKTVSFFSRRGVQVFGKLVKGKEVSFYLFSAVWTESLFDDEKTLESLLNGYLDGSFTAEEYTGYVSNAVNGSSIRQEQAAETLSFINSIAGEEPVVLMGSLNALPGSEELDMLTDAGFVDVFSRAGRGAGYTLDSAGNTSFKKFPEGSPQAALKSLSGQYRSDYILVRGSGVRPVSAEVVLDEPVYGVYPSCRYGVKAVIEFAPNPSAQ